jgi:hypothetical protein
LQGIRKGRTLMTYEGCLVHEARLCHKCNLHTCCWYSIQFQQNLQRSQLTLCSL